MRLTGRACGDQIQTLPVPLHRFSSSVHAVDCGAAVAALTDGVLVSAGD